MLVQRLQSVQSIGMCTMYTDSPKSPPPLTEPESNESIRESYQSIRHSHNPRRPRVVVFRLLALIHQVVGL